MSYLLVRVRVGSVILLGEGNIIKASISHHTLVCTPNLPVARAWKEGGTHFLPGAIGDGWAAKFVRRIFYWSFTLAEGR